MGERKTWTTEEDAALRTIVESGRIKKWSSIARCMQTEYNMKGRTGKQCRQRWHNQLAPHILNTPWTPEEEKILFDEHNEHGNSWALIAKKLPGRTDNNIKNHFYSTLRKAIRRLNKFVAEAKDKTNIREIKGFILSKLITIAQEKFQKKLNVRSDLPDLCFQLKNKLIKYAHIKDEEDDDFDEDEARIIIKQILDFNKAYKRKRTKKKKSKDDEEDEEDEEEDEVEEERRPSLLRKASSNSKSSKSKLPLLKKKSSKSVTPPFMKKLSSKDSKTISSGGKKEPEKKTTTRRTMTRNALKEAMSNNNKAGTTSRPDSPPMPGSPMQTLLKRSSNLSGQMQRKESGLLRDSEPTELLGFFKMGTGGLGSLDGLAQSIQLDRSAEYNMIRRHSSRRGEPLLGDSGIFGYRFPAGLTNSNQFANNMGFSTQFGVNSQFWPGLNNSINYDNNTNNNR